MAAVTAAIAAGSAVLAPHLWDEWVLFLLASRHGPAATSVLIGASLPVRLAVAASQVFWGAPYRPRVLALAAPLARPLVGLSTLTVPAALPRLVAHGRHPRATTVPKTAERRRAPSVSRADDPLAGAKTDR